MPRLFTGIEIPREIGDRLALLRGGLPGARIGASQALTELQAEHERILQRIGLPPEQRKSPPHVTLARLKGATGRAIADYLSVRGGFLAGPFSVDRFVLFSSRNSIGGGPYIGEEAYPLAPGGRDRIASAWAGEYRAPTAPGR